MFLMLVLVKLNDDGGCRRVMFIVASSPFGKVLVSVFVWIRKLVMCCSNSNDGSETSYVFVFHPLVFLFPFLSIFSSV